MATMHALKPVTLYNFLKYFQVFHSHLTEQLDPCVSFLFFSFHFFFFVDNKKKIQKRIQVHRTCTGESLKEIHLKFIQLRLISKRKNHTIKKIRKRRVGSLTSIIHHPKIQRYQKLRFELYNRKLNPIKSFSTNGPMCHFSQELSCFPLSLF